MKKLLVAIGLCGTLSGWAAQEVYLTESDNGTSSVNTAGHWSSGKAPEPGYDYVVTNTIGLQVQSASWSGRHVFGGDHLILRNARTFSWAGGIRTQWLDVNLIVEGTTQLWPNNGGRVINLEGTINIAEGGVLKCPTSCEGGGISGFCLRSAISGSGLLQIYLARYETYKGNYYTTEKTCRLEGDNSAFTGRIIAGGCGDLYIVSESSLGQPPATFTADWLALHGTHLCVTNDVVIDDATRGIRISNDKKVSLNGDNMTVVYPGGGFDVAEGKTLTLGSILTAVGPVTKYGAGTLVLANTLENITSSLTVTNGTLAIDGANRVLSVPLTLYSGGAIAVTKGSAFSVQNVTCEKATLGPFAGEMTATSLTLKNGGSLSVDLTDRDSAVPCLTVSDALTFDGYPLLAVRLAPTSIHTAGAAYAILKAPAGTIMRRVREMKIFLAEPWLGDLSATTNADGTETLWLTPRDQNKTFYAVKGAAGLLQGNIWTNDVTTEAVAAAAGNVYVVNADSVRSDIAGTFVGDHLIFNGKNYTNKASNKLVTIPRMTMTGLCELGFSLGGIMKIDGALALLPNFNDPTAPTLKLDGRNSRRPLELYSDLSGCGIISMHGNLPPENEYNLYALLGDSTNFVGQIQVCGQTNFYCRIEKEENLGGNPESFVADQLRFNGGGLSVAKSVVLDDPNRGIYLDGTGGIALENGEDGCYWKKGGYTEADRIYHGGATFNTTAAGVTLTVNCPISGTGGVYVRAYGTVALGGDNTHSGTNVVQEGILALNSRQALGTGALNVWAGATVAVANDAEKMPYGVELGGPVVFAAGSSLTVAAKANGAAQFAVPLFLLAPGETVDLADIPLPPKLIRGYAAKPTLRTVTVGGAERQLLEATFERRSLAIILY